MKIQIRNRTFEVGEDQYREYWDDIHSGKWEPQTFAVLDYFVSNEDTVLDAGAWIGPVTLYAAQIASEVFAVEPDPVAFTYLQNNIRRNPEMESNIRSFNVALSDNNKKYKLYARKRYGVSSSSLLPRIKDRLFTTEVQGITFRQFIDNEKIGRIDFIKLDIEGGEFLLLPAMADDLKILNYPTMYISFHYNYLTEHQYLLKIKWKLLSRVLMKLENYFDFDLFRGKNRNIVLNSLQSFKDYKFIYSDSGQKLSFEFLLLNPFFIKKHNLIVTNEAWSKK